MPRTKKTTTIPLMLRLPPDVHSLLVKAAEYQGVSMNEFMIGVLIEKFDKETVSLEQRVAELERRLAAIEGKPAG